MIYNGVEEKEKKFNYVKKRISKDNSSQRICFRLPKHATIDHSENVSVFDLETYNFQDFAEAYAAGFYDVNRFRDRWGRDLTT